MTVHATFQGTERFQVLRRLGSGSFGNVYEVLDRSEGIRVALKQPHDPQAQGLLRFKQEFRTLAEVSHPNLVSLFELVGSEGQWCFTMELVEGTDLYTSLRGPLQPTLTDPRLAHLYLGFGSTSAVDPPTPPYPSSDSWGGDGETLVQLPPSPSSPRQPDRIRRMFAQVAEGLLALHREGLIHRDLKPSNVMVTPGDRVVILDFGLAVPTAPQEGHYGRRERVTGTPAYLAPEQLEGSPASESGDWYAFGVMLFQALTGVLPFQGAYRELLHRKRTENAPAPSTLVEGIPEDLDRLVCSLLHRDPGHRPSGPEVLLRLDPSAPPLRPGHAPPRDDLGLPGCHPTAQKALLEAFEQVRMGHPAVALLHGLPGMGKSAVVRQFLREVRGRSNRVLVLHARCFAQENLPFKAVDGLVDDLAELLRYMDPRALRPLLPEHTAALARLFPVLEQVAEIRASHPPVPDLPDPLTLRRRAFGALGELLRRLAKRHPLLLVVEDLQWGDRDSESLLLDLLHTRDTSPCLLVLTCPTEDLNRSQLLQALRGPKPPCPLTTVRLDLLPPDRCLEVTRAALTPGQDPDGTLARWAAQESGGHPFFLAELIQLLRQRPASLPQDQLGLDAHLKARLQSLPATSYPLLETLAVAGHPVDWPVLTLAAGVEGQTEPLLPVLRNAHVLRVRGSAAERKVVEFFHERFRQPLTQDLSPEQIRAAHRSLAEAYARLRPEEAGTLAFHFSRGGEPIRAAHHARAAAEAAAHALAFDRAAELFQLSISLRPPADPVLSELYRQMGDALAHAGRGPEAAEAYLRTASLLKGETAVRAFRRAAEEYFRSGHIEKGIEILAPQLKAFGESFPTSRLGILLNLAWWRLRLRLRGLKIAPEGPLDPVELERVDLLWAAAMGLAPVDPFRSTGFQARQLWHTLRLGEPFRVVRGLAHETLFQALRGSRNLRRIREVLDLTIERAAALDHPNPEGRALIAQGLSAICQGNWRLAHRSLEAAEHLLGERCTGLDYEVHIAQNYGMVAASVLGDLPLLRRRLPVLLQEARDRGNWLAQTHLRTCLGLYPALMEDDPGAALHELREALQGWPQHGFQTVHFFELVSRLNVELYAGRTFGPRAYLQGIWPKVRRSAFLRAQAMRITMLELRSRLAVACAAQMPTDGLRRSLLLLRAKRDALTLRREHLAYGEALALKQLACIRYLQGDEMEAEELLHQAMDAFGACDMALHGALCNLALGLWASDGARVDEATAWLTGQGIRQPERWLAMHLPLGDAFRKR